MVLILVTILLALVIGLSFVKFKRFGRYYNSLDGDRLELFNSIYIILTPDVNKERISIRYNVIHVIDANTMPVVNISGIENKRGKKDIVLDARTLLTFGKNPSANEIWIWKTGDSVVNGEPLKLTSTTLDISGDELFEWWENLE